MILNFIMEHRKPAIGQNTTKNEQKLPAAERASSCAIPQKDSLMQKRSNVQYNNDVTKQSQFHSFHKVHGHFGIAFVKPSRAFNFFTPFNG